MTQNLIVSQGMINQLIRLGVTQFVISPGSRSTPLTVAAARNPEAQTMVHFDERGAAFFALGHAKARGVPAVLICTSGTAVANYFPAVVEASMANIPLIILSADRPPELIDVGANQAIFQDNIYGNYPRLFKNLTPPSSTTQAEEVSTLITELYQAATGSRPGPVHLNCQFREPLLPISGSKFDNDCDPINTSVSHMDLSPQVDHGDNGRDSHAQKPGIPVAHLEQINQQIEESQTGIIIVGRSVDAQYDETILNLAESLNWPIFPDVQSRLRFTQHPQLINHFDLALLNGETNLSQPEMVIHIGGPFTSKRLLTYLNDPDIFYVSVKATPERIDPNQQVDLAIQMDVASFCESVHSHSSVFTDPSMRLRETKAGSQDH
ncbi:MAG: 2-succinyl-5-enolpyruvyl-6-hydroxy-3-cyclohexene-1-carboxylic-acid synthase, partial [Candidatus Marinimicrobia bacterium]|nr:2-succinyl-5-enolpyruvyl-6-hydroxy-3-cyclohexene-1-carboxylic-acid synthase [Candidatus Neomarinimicrobiota bacterium]